MIQTSQLSVHHGTHAFLAMASKDHIRTCLHCDLIFVKNHTPYVANMQPCTTTQTEIHYVVIYIHNHKDHNSLLKLMNIGSEITFCKGQAKV